MMKNPLPKVRAMCSLIALVRDPNRIGEVFALADAVMDEAMLDAMLANISRHEQGRRALDERPRLGRIELSTLCAMPVGTLGRVYGDHMVKNGLDPATLPIRETTSPRAYILPHIYETHDVWHIVTGFV